MKFEAPFLTYRHIEHLLMSCLKACELEEIEKHEKTLIKLFKKIIGPKKRQDKDFYSYVNRNLIRIRKVTKKEGLDQPFKVMR